MIDCLLHLQMTKVEKKDKAKKQEEECVKKAAEEDEAYSKQYNA